MTTYTVIHTTDTERTVTSGLDIHAAYKMWKSTSSGNIHMMTDTEYFAANQEENAA